MTELFAALLATLQTKYPKFKVVVREKSRFMKLLAWLMFWAPGFLTDYVTTIGYTTYMPAYLIGTDIGYAVLRHEAVHVAQYRRWSWLYCASYLLCLPCFITLRAYWEFQGYRETMAVEFEQTGTVSDKTVEFVVQQFCGPGYCYMWYNEAQVRRWITKAIADIKAPKP